MFGQVIYLVVFVIVLAMLRKNVILGLLIFLKVYQKKKSTIGDYESKCSKIFGLNMFNSPHLKNDFKFEI